MVMGMLCSQVSPHKPNYFAVVDLFVNRDRARILL